MSATLQAQPWTPEEDALIRYIAKTRGGSAEMVRRLPHRTNNACLQRLVVLRRSIPAAETGPKDRVLLEQSSKSLLRALLRYGLRKPSPKGLPGLSASRFFALCREHGILAIPTR